MARPVNESVLRALVGEVQDANDARQVLAVAAEPAWQGDPVLATEGGAVRVVPCVSPLAVRDVLAHVDDQDADVLIILTDQNEQALGEEVLARVWRQRLLRPSAWEAAKHLFRVDHLDPTLADTRWLIDLLVEVAPPRGYAPPPSGFLDADTAWRTFLRYGLRLHVETPTLGDLLRWGQTDAARSALSGVAHQHRVSIAKRLEDDEASSAAQHVLRLAAAGRGADLVPLGLVADVLWSDDAAEGREALTARIRFEGPLGAKEIDAQTARAWGDAATRLVRETDDQEDHEAVARWLARAQEILVELDAVALATTSDVLSSAFTERLRDAGQALQMIQDAPTEERLDALHRALTHVEQHRRARQENDADRVERLRMAVRLMRRTLRRPEHEAQDLEGLASAFVADGAWVDAAREALGHGETVPPLAEAYARLIEKVDEERATRDREFGAALAAWSSVLPTRSAPLLPIERVLEEVVAQVTRRAPTLLLVLDGLSYPEATRLFADFTSTGWVEQGPGGRELPQVVAALPTITRISRASLLSGRLQEGGQDVERAGFESHAALRDAAGGTTPRLYHKKDLKIDQGRIAPEVRDAVLDPTVPIVGVVVNAVDDHLDKGSQLRLAEGLRALRPLRPLMDAAAEAGRAVVVASDHGHVLENGSIVKRASGAGERWRPATEPPGEDEVLLRGPRVVGNDGAVVAPAVEKMRYMAAEKRGYHGGATPQEVLCPLIVLTSGGTALEGWEPLPVRRPGWWDTFQRPQEILRPRVVPAEPVVDPSGQTLLFTEQGEAVAPTIEADGWVGELLSSPILAEQREAAGRQALDDESLATFLAIFDQTDGVAPPAVFADAMGLPQSRLRTKLEALRRMLNVDGYPVLTLETDGTARLNRELLATQFRITL